MNNRTIKFRAWDKTENKWYGQKEFYLHDMESGCFTDDVVWMQFTRLLDKNGKEIYEGDIVRIEMIEQKESVGNIEPRIVMSKPTEIRWENGCFKPVCYWDATTGMRTEVIGNIYENPELLK